MLLAQNSFKCHSLTQFSFSDALEWVRNAREEVTVSSSKLCRRRISCQS